MERCWRVEPVTSIVIEPGQGFGTGQHPTTRMVARALDDLADEVQSVLDVLQSDYELVEDGPHGDLWRHR